MSLSEINKIENERTECDFLTIHLFEGGKFWSAYEWSAYLINFFPSDLTDEEKSSPHKFVYGKEKNEMIKVGIPKVSFEKFLPNTLTNEYSINTDEKHLILDVKNLFLDVDFDVYKQLFNEWKVKYEVKKSNNKKKEKIISEDIKNPPLYNICEEKNINVEELLHQIIYYPLENKTLLENVCFISNIKYFAVCLAKNK